MLYVYLPIFYAFMTYLAFSFFFDISLLCGSSVSFFKLSQISKFFSNIFTEKTQHRRSLVVQQVKDLALSLLWLRWQLWRAFHLWLAGGPAVQTHIVQGSTVYVYIFGKCTFIHI